MNSEDYWFYVTFWGYLMSTAISMFGMMVLLIALLKITNSCCVWVPSEAAIFNRNEWYNTVSDGPEISLETKDFAKKRLFGLIPLERGKGYSIKWWISYYLPKTGFVIVEMIILGFDIWSFVFVYGYIDPKWGMFWFLSLMIMSFKTLLTGALVFDTSLMTSRAKKLQSKTFHCVLIGVFHNVMMMPLQMNFIQRVRHYRPDIFDALQITPADDYVKFVERRDILNLLLYSYMFVRTLFSMLFNVDEGKIKPRNYYLNAICITAMLCASYLKYIGPQETYPRNTFPLIEITQHNRVTVALFDTNLPVFDWVLYGCLAIFLFCSLLICIFWLIDSPLPDHDQYTQRTVMKRKKMISLGSSKTNSEEKIHLLEKSAKSD